MTATEPTTTTVEIAAAHAVAGPWHGLTGPPTTATGEQHMMTETRTCGIHGDDTTGGRCAVCDHLAAGGHSLPAEFTIDRFVGTNEHAVPIFRTIQNSEASPWASLLDLLPTIEQGQTADLKVQTRDLRVWLARTTTEDGEPFDRTVYVEALRGGRWMDFGYFDGDEPDPRPLGTLGDAWNATYRRLGVEIA